jgi:DNA helicase IV|tara:strand:- start:5203 stop:7308 length:2106 start_codon:yes stop_codon:yes gene_type:complete
VTHPEIEAEQSYIDRAHRLLEQARDRARKLRGMVEVSRGGTTQARYERDAIEGSIQNRLGQLQLGSASLIFGRIDLDSHDQFHIGRLAVADEQQEPVVVDWRAPVAEPFYRATGRDPMGIVRRRHFVSRGRELLDIEDELFDLDQLDEGFQGHGALLAALDQNRDGQLRDIVATIQGEQDEIIRDPLKGMLIVQGGPGTGKTVVALHRAAYLLYTHRFPLEGQGVLVVGPNRLFLRYIEQVLPSLGEAGVYLTVLADLLADIFDDVRVTLPDLSDSAAVKGNERMVSVVADAIRDRERALRDDLVVGFGLVRLRISVAQSRGIVREARRRYRRHNAGRRYVEREFFAALAASHHSQPDHDNVRHRLRRDSRVLEALERMWPVLTPAQLLRDLFGSKALIASAAGEHFSEEESLTLFRPRGESLSDYRWSDADVALLDEAYSGLGPRLDRQRKARDPEIRTFGHIVVDETQDHTPMALRMISRRSLNGSMTLVGDIAQATAPGAAANWDEVLNYMPTGASEHRVRELTLSYRIPAPNLELANKVLAVAAPELVPPKAVRSVGSPPRVVEVAGHPIASAQSLVEKAVSMVIEESEALEGGSVAVIAPASLIEMVDESLRAKGVDYGRATTASRNISGPLHPKIALVPVQLVKGLELDGTVVIEPATILDEEPQGLRALFVALTRSTKRLAIVHARPLPRVLVD